MMNAIIDGRMYNNISMVNDKYDVECGLVEIKHTRENGQVVGFIIPSSDVIIEEIKKVEKNNIQYMDKKEFKNIARLRDIKNISIRTWNGENGQYFDVSIIDDCDCEDAIFVSDEYTNNEIKSFEKLQKSWIKKIQSWTTISIEISAE